MAWKNTYKINYCDSLWGDLQALEPAIVSQEDISYSYNISFLKLMTGSKYDKMLTELIFNEETIGVFIALFILIFPLFLNLSK